ncbi:MAG: prepilin peptidase [Clostridia bacterium]
MQSIIVFVILSFIVSLILTNFIKLSEKNRGKDFEFKEYIKNFSIKNLDLKYSIIFFILFMILTKEKNILSIITIVPVCFSLILALIMDIKYMIIPNTCSIVIFLSGIIKLFGNFSKENLINSLIGLIIGGFTLFIIDYIFEKITQKEGFGYGDMKLLASIGFFVDYKSIIVIMILSVFLSAIFSILYLIINKVKNIKDAYLPFGPFIVISTFIVCIIPATTIISWYIQLMDVLVNKMI